MWEIPLSAETQNLREKKNLLQNIESNDKTNDKDTSSTILRKIKPIEI